MSDRPFLSGSLQALGAALLFGLTIPIVKHFGEGVGPFATALLLYAGAAVGAGLPRRRSDEPPLDRQRLARVALVALFGAALAPTALAWGLQRVGALTGALLLNLEAVFTVALARLFYREPLGKRGSTAMGLMVTGGALLALRAAPGQSTTLGLVALLLATLGWALDNTLTRPLSDLDPRAVVFWKASFGVLFSLAGALVLHDAWPNMASTSALLACGATGYGLSLRFYLRAQRSLGAARAGSLFALAPFVGAAIAFALGDRAGLPQIAASSVLFGVAVYLHLTEGHGHFHSHDAEEHEHAHRHDDGHHSHTHAPPVEGTHSHAHRHEPVGHEHPHGSDLHHRHRH